MTTPPLLPPFGFTAVWRVLTTLSSGPWTVATFLAELAAIGCYLHAVRLLHARGRSWSVRRTVAFVVGVATLFLAWQTGIPVYATSVFTVHIFQHLILMAVAPILFGISAPVTLAMQTLDRHRKVRLLRLFHGPGMRTFTHPLVSSAGNYGLMFWFFLGGGIVVSMTHPAFMDFVNCLFLFFGCLVWWPVLSVDYIGRRQYSNPVRWLLGMSGMPFDTIVAMAMVGDGATISIAPKMYSVASMQAGAAVFWILAGSISAVGSWIPARQWIANERRKNRRSDALLENRSLVMSESRYGWWGDEVAIEADGTMRVPWASSTDDGTPPEL